jgi:phosphoserine phosphatase
VPLQAAYVFDELKRRTPDEPQLAADPMVQAALDGDIATLMAGVDSRVETWMASVQHPRFGRRYDQLTFQPQQQLLVYLRANGFRTFIVSGGGADFMRVWTERVYGIPPEQVVGTTGTVKYELREGKPELTRQPTTSS